MAEVIAVMASAVQLANCCAGVWTLIHDIESITPDLQRYKQHIAELLLLSDSILKNEGRIYRVLSFINKKGDLLESLEDIEKKKTSLSLHMHLIQVEFLSEIRDDISAMENKKEKAQNQVGLRRSSPKPVHHHRTSSLVATEIQVSGPEREDTRVVQLQTVPAEEAHQATT
ncbi:hypothetical protein BP5796_09138 [Coleophoma crateriformis]|uniref:Fungal N-terminal domain-containing protein n=1 Tax=Coleophoma crateriformis TaxID=565419 RepID=A0A3D8R3I8_9HELO|nr:hypothetical protein BP5796_09138 [Coleophoma crateriformis]